MPTNSPADRHRTESAPPELIPAPTVARLPVAVPAFHNRARQRQLRRAAFALGLLAVAAAGLAAWWLRSAPPVPPGIAWGNGRLEADEIDIDTKFAGRIAKLLVDEGALVTAGQVVAVMDTQDLEATLRNREAVARQAQRNLDAARANVDQQKSQVVFAKQELDRVTFLVPKGFASKELLDQRRQQMDAAVAALAAANDNVGAAEHALDAAKHDVELYQINIADNTLVAPRLGRIQYRIANVGEVLPAGGKIFTMLDATYV